MRIPSNKVGVVIGYGGRIVREMQDDWGCSIQIQKMEQPSNTSMVYIATRRKQACSVLFATWCADSIVGVCLLNWQYGKPMTTAKVTDKYKTMDGKRMTPDIKSKLPPKPILADYLPVTLLQACRSTGAAQNKNEMVTPLASTVPYVFWQPSLTGNAYARSQQTKRT